MDIENHGIETERLIRENNDLGEALRAANTLIDIMRNVGQSQAKQNAYRFYNAIVVKAYENRESLFPRTVGSTTQKNSRSIYSLLMELAKYNA